jgi:nucleoside-diphosphate-sugar epimerase
MTMRVLVTGSQGYIGTVMVPMLLTEGHEVTGMDSDLYRYCTYGAGMPEIPLVLKDIRDARCEDFRGFDAVVHLAALSNDPLSDLNPEITYEINHRASVRLAELAREAGVRRFVFSSSCSTYGMAGDDMLAEDAELRPVTPYGVSKVRVEEEVSRLADARFTPIFLRNATAYGVSPRMRFDLVINNLIAWAYTTGLVYLKSDGTPWRPVVHVEDISRAVIAVLNAPRDVVHAQSFNVGINEENYRIRELAEIVRDAVPGCRIEYAKDAGPDKRCYRVDFGKYHSAFPGYPLQWNVRRGVGQIFESYKRIGLKKEDFEGPKFMRIAHIKKLLAGGELGPDLRWRTTDRPGQPVA